MMSLKRRHAAPCQGRWSYQHPHRPCYKEFLASIHYHGRSFRDIVDWPQGTPANETELRSGHGSVTFEGETDRYIFSDINTVVNAFHYRNLVLMAKIAGVLEKSEDEVFFRKGPHWSNLQ
jgi:alpha-L-rhamnosidase